VQPRDPARAAGYGSAKASADLGAMGEARRRSRCADLSSPEEKI
jgi:hypothetical protein